MQFVKYYESYYIQLFQFITHSTHFLQPLDRVLFQQYKHIHKRVINKVIYLSSFDFNKNNFFNKLYDIQLKTFTKHII